MFKIDSAGSASGSFVEEDVSIGQEPTSVTAEWLNATQSELVALVEMHGGALSKSDSQQAAKSLINALRTQLNIAYTTSGVGASFVISTPPGGFAISSLKAGLRLRVKFHTSASGPGLTLYTVGTSIPFIRQYNSMGSKVSPYIAEDQLCDMEFDGVDWVILNPLPSIVFTPGMSIRWVSPIPPEGWLIRNGAAISRSAYAELFAVIGTTFGAGNGSTTFNLPDDRDRMPIGAGGLYGLGATGGSKDAVVVTHSHAFTTNADGYHVHSYKTYGLGNNGLSGNANTNSDWGYANTGSSGSHTHTGTTNSSGSSGVGANLPPYISDYSIIKY